MKKHYLKPTTRIVKLKQQCKILSGSPLAKSLNNSDGLNWDPDGLDNSDDLR